MSDAKLRELEKRWKETGSVEDEAAYLLERIRIGDLLQEKLELAAYLGHEGASAASGQSRGMFRDREWGEKLAKLGGAGACSRAILALRRAHIPLSDLDPEEREVALHALLGFEEWVALGSTASDITDPVLKGLAQRPRLSAFAQAAGHAVSILSCLPPRNTLAELLAAVRDEIVPWLLGYSDPVRERVEAREAAGE